MTIDEFILFEKEHHLFDMKINEVSFWTIIRAPLYDKIFGMKNDLGVAHDNNRVTKKIYKILKGSLKGLTHNPFNNSKNVDIFYLNHPRKVKDKDTFKCIYTDILISNSAYSNVIFEEPYQNIHYPTNLTNVRYTDVIDNIVMLKWFFLKKKYYKRIDFTYIQYIFELLEVKFHILMNVEHWKKLISRYVFIFEEKRKIYLKLLKSYNPKIIVEVVYYSLTRYIINSVAKELNIPVVELQHGAMGNEIIAYNSLSEIPYFPDYLFLFGVYWKENTRIPLNAKNIKIVGWPYLDSKISNKKVVESNKKTVLFISQGPSGKLLSKIACDLSEIVDFDKYNIIYKLHPGEYNRWKKDYPYLTDTKIHIIDNNFYDMHHYFSISNIQIGINSTAIFEGLNYNLMTILIKTAYAKEMEDLVVNGYAKYVTSAAQIMDLLTENTFGIFDSSMFWEKNSYEKYLLEIQKIIFEKGVK
jgi:hypothetical protein